MDSELLSKFIGYFSDYLSVLSYTLLRWVFFFFWTTFVETAVYEAVYLLPSSLTVRCSDTRGLTAISVGLKVKFAGDYVTARFFSGDQAYHMKTGLYFVFSHG